MRGEKQRSGVRRAGEKLHHRRPVELQPRLWRQPCAGEKGEELKKQASTFQLQALNPIPRARALFPIARA
jgi:hypothetical protein